MSPLPTCRFRLHQTDPGLRALEPFTTGIALPRGWCRDVSHLRLVDRAGAPQPIQVAALEHWSDQSVRWVLLHFQAAADADAAFELGIDPEAASPEHVSPLTVRTSASQTRVSTGDTDFVFSTGTASPLASVSRGGHAVLDAAPAAFVVTAADSGVLPVRFDRIVVEDSGPLRAAVVVHGSVEADVTLALTCRVEVFAGIPAARLRFVLHNPRAAQHAGGFWELGDPGSVLLRRVAFEAGPTQGCEGARAAASFARGMPPCGVETPFRIQQESSGGANWQSAVHVDRDGRLPRFAGYQVAAGAEVSSGARACPIVVAGTGTSAIAVTSRLFWEVFPKAYSVDAAGRLGVELLPEIGALHELQGGERFTHEIVLGFGSLAEETLEVFRSPSTVIVDPAWWAATGDVSSLFPVADPAAPYERLVAAAVDGGDTFLAKRERIDEYGWRHFGDLYADHENGQSADGPRIVSHYNNQYDPVAGAIVQFMRRGDSRWWDVARDLATHVAHVDIYWTGDDKSAYNGGLFWHTYHYVDAGRATHRTYPHVTGVSGGGPSVEHNYSTGLMLHYYLTGDPASREAVLGLAHWTVAMDDGSTTVFRWLSRSPTGLASATGAVDYHGPGRGPGNAIQTLLNAFRLTRDRTWIERAETLIARAIHPDDNLVERNLLDAERRWYYTVFLQAIGRYLGVKRELGEMDARWHYARASLLHYARWMAVHEYPYLEKPEILEYPTETWAAQDMRKCEVLDLAAMYTADPEERALFVERARFFFEASVSTLHQWPTRTWTRPVVLMLSYGYAHLWHESHRDEMPLLPASPSLDFGRPARFEPQKVIALRRAKRIVLAGALLAVAAAAAMLIGG